MAARLRPLLAALVAGVLLLTGCRVDVAVDVVMAEDGSGTVTVTVTADADVVDAAPGLAADLRVDDLEAAGWTVDGPTDTADGGLEVVLTYEYASPDEATRALGLLSGPRGPFIDPVLRRVVDGRTVTYSIAGVLALADGVAAFADTEAVSLAGEVPYQRALDERGLALEDALGITLSVQLPGEVRKTTGLQADGVVSWTVPLDGSSASLVTSAVDPGPSDTWGIVATVLLVLLVAWVVVAAGFIAFVVVARRRRAAQRARPRPLHPPVTRRR